MEAPPIEWDGMGWATVQYRTVPFWESPACVCPFYDCCVLRRSGCTVRTTETTGGRLLLNDQATLEMMTRGP